jgi:uncharacterized protein
MKNRFIVLFISTILILVLGVCSLFAATLPSKPNTNIYVQDYAGMLSGTTEQDILNTAKALDDQTTAQVVIVTIDSLDNSNIEEYANELFRTWGIGDKEKNNGVLLLVSKNDRESRIEVGYGLEGQLNDAKTGRIQDQAIPYFQEGNYNQGIDIIFNLLVTEVCKEYDIENLGSPLETKSSEGIPQFVWFILFIVIVLIIAGIGISGGGSSGGGGGTSRRIGGGSTRGGYFGSGSGGFGGFGGGSSGGGGSSRRW